jgi:hypothetical protein
MMDFGASRKRCFSQTPTPKHSADLCSEPTIFLPFERSFGLTTCQRAIKHRWDCRNPRCSMVGSAKLTLWLRAAVASRPRMEAWWNALSRASPFQLRGRRFGWVAQRSRGKLFIDARTDIRGELNWIRNFQVTTTNSGTS